MCCRHYFRNVLNSWHENNRRRVQEDRAPTTQAKGECQTRQPEVPERIAVHCRERLQVERSAERVRQLELYSRLACEAIQELGDTTALPAPLSSFGRSLRLHRSLAAPQAERLNQKNTTPKDESGHLHWAHIVISNEKAFIGGTFHGLDAKHLQRYLDEFCYRFNRRFFPKGIFPRLINACLSTGKIRELHT